MTLVETLSVAAGAIGTAIGTFTATHFVTAKKLSASVGATKPGDDSLRDMISRVEGKIDAQHEATSERLDGLSHRLELVERRVFTPPSFSAFRGKK